MAWVSVSDATLTHLFFAALAGFAAVFFASVALLIAFVGGRVVVGAVLLACLVTSAGLAWRWRRSASAAGAEALRRFANAAFAVSLVAAVAAFAGNLVAARRPTQAALAARFSAHRADYERLRAMLQADALGTIADCGASFARKGFVYETPERLGLSAERVASYRSALRAVGCPMAGAQPDGSVTFALASWGPANRGWRMQLLWSKQEPNPLLASLDGFRKTKGRSEWESGYSWLDGDWYLGIVW